MSCGLGVMDKQELLVKLLAAVWVGLQTAALMLSIWFEGPFAIWKFKNCQIAKLSVFVPFIKINVAKQATEDHSSLNVEFESILLRLWGWCLIINLIIKCMGK